VELLNYIERWQSYSWTDLLEVRWKSRWWNITTCSTTLCLTADCSVCSASCHSRTHSAAERSVIDKGLLKFSYGQILLIYKISLTSNYDSVTGTLTKLGILSVFYSLWLFISYFLFLVSLCPDPNILIFYHILIAPIWSVGHPWNALFHFSFLIQLSR
jgi:hypothetical protein